jgi:hypothetical protein
MVDIEPLGFETITMDGYITDEVVERVRRVLADADLRKRMVDRNHAIAKQHFSMTVLRRRLRILLLSAEPTPDEEFA